jgi:hypothetical protein
MGLFGFILICSTLKAASNQLNKIRNFNYMYNTDKLINKNKFNSVILIPRQCRLKTYPNIIYKNPCRCNDKCAEIKYIDTK